MNALTLRLSVVVTIMVAGPPTSGQTIVRTPKALIQILGLRNWSLQRFQDSLAKLAPGTDLTSAACGAIIRNRLRFPAADVESQLLPIAGRTVRVLTFRVVDPEDSGLVDYLPVHRASLRPPSGWQEGLALVRDQTWLFAELQSEQFRRGDGALGGFLAKHNSTGDLNTALYTLDRDASRGDRLVATILLANFWSTNRAWRALVRELRDRDDRGATTAGLVLTDLIRIHARKVDWRPAIESVRALLDGTNPTEFQTVLRTMIATDIDPALTNAILRHAGRALYFELQSVDPSGRALALTFLQQMSQSDVWDDMSFWHTWLKGEGAIL